MVQTRMWELSPAEPFLRSKMLKDQLWLERHVIPADPPPSWHSPPCPKGGTQRNPSYTPGSFCSPCSLPAAPSTALSKNMAEKWEGPKIASHSGLHELQIPLQNHFSSKRRKEIHLQSPPRSGNHLSVYVWFQGISQFLSFDHKLHLFIPLSHRWHLLHPPFNHTTMGKAICY